MLRPIRPQRASTAGFATGRVPVSVPTTQLDNSACNAIVRWMPHATLLLDEGHRVVLGNRVAATLFRCPLDRLRGASIGELVPERNLTALLRNIGEQPVTIETARTDATPTLKIEAVRVPLAHSGRPASAFTLLMIEDISEKALLEQQLVDTEKQAAMGQLAAGILHEIANPLTGIGSNLLFVRGALPEGTAAAVKQALDLSLEQVDQMRQLLGTLSGFPRRPPLRYERADLHEVLRTCLTFVARDAERRRIELAALFAADRIECEIDVRMIKQVVLNLLKNAMEALPSGGRIEVRTSLRERGGLRPATAIVEIADNGLGIPGHDLRKVFRPLFSTKPRGAGLGLSFCRQAIEEHGGEIRLTSRGERQGTTAIVGIPVRQLAALDD
jgi:signal transduction histidine kinase